MRVVCLEVFWGKLKKIWSTWKFPLSLCIWSRGMFSEKIFSKEKQKNFFLRIFLMKIKKKIFWFFFFWSSQMDLEKFSLRPKMHVFETRKITLPILSNLEVLGRSKILFQKEKAFRKKNWKNFWMISGKNFLWWMTSNFCFPSWSKIMSSFNNFELFDLWTKPLLLWTKHWKERSLSHKLSFFKKKHYRKKSFKNFSFILFSKNFKFLNKFFDSQQE